MLNYANLNDIEFEALCKDIMERILGVSLRRFGPGRDGGVDLTDDVSNKAIIFNVKAFLVGCKRNQLTCCVESL